MPATSTRKLVNDDARQLHIWIDLFRDINEDDAWSYAEGIEGANVTVNSTTFGPVELVRAILYFRVTSGGPPFGMRQTQRVGRALYL